MSALTQYNFYGSRFRVLMDKYGSPWFPASDVCRVLSMDYEKRGTGIYVEHISEKHKRGLSSIEGLTPSNELPPHTTMLSEAGLYQLILKSRKPEAVKFQEWLTEEVLPSIRKTGSYVHKAKVSEPPLMVQTREATDAAFEEALEKSVRAMRSELARMKDELKGEVLGAMSLFAPRRREVPGSVRDTHRQFTVHRGLRCPCCDTVKSSWSDFNIDHYKDRQDPSLTATWAICADCNQSIKDAQLHKEAEPAFLAVQKWLKDWRLNNRVIPSVEVQQGLFEQ